MRTKLRKPIVEYLNDIRDTFEVVQQVNAQDVTLVAGEKPILKIAGSRGRLTALGEWTNETFDVFLGKIVENYHFTEDEIPESEIKLMLARTLTRYKHEDYTQEYIQKTPLSELRKQSTYMTLYNSEYFTSLRKSYIELQESHYLKDYFHRKICKECAGSFDVTIDFGNKRLRTHLMSTTPKGTSTEGYQKTLASTAIRVIPKDVPKLEDLNLPNLSRMLEVKRGIIMVTGDTGVGKSTTVAGIVNDLNCNSQEVVTILMLEEPVEFIHENKQGVVLQRTVGENGDVLDYERATKDVLREDVDVVVFAEVRTQQEIQSVLNLAEAGKRVIMTYHGTEVSDSITRFKEASGDDERTQKRLFSNLIGIIHQEIITVDQKQYPLVSGLIVTDIELRERLKTATPKEIEEVILELPNDLGFTKLNSFETLVEKNLVSESMKHDLFD